MRWLICDTDRLDQATDVGGWRQRKHLRAVVKKKFNAVRKTSRARPEKVEGYLCRRLVEWADERPLSYRGSWSMKRWCRHYIFPLTTYFAA